MIDPKVDDQITAYIMIHFDIFQNVSPNSVTIVGILCNFIILYMTIKSEYNYVILFLSIMIRFLSDCLDGAIARKYNKQSKIGHYLDTFSDMFFMFVMINSIVMKFKLTSLVYLIGVAILGLLHFNYSILSSHSSMKSKNDTFIDNTVRFFTNNSIVTHILFFLVMYYL